MNRPLRIAVLADYREEGWPSMDVVAGMTVDALNRGGRVSAHLVCPALPRPGGLWKGASGRNASRLLGRFLHYPRHAAKLVRGFDVFHVIDHSYAQLVHALPAHRCLVTCHDLDTFRCLFPHDPEPRPPWFRLMTRRILQGMQAAAHVTCVSETTAQDLRQTGWIAPERLSVTPNGVCDSYFLTPPAEALSWRRQWLAQTGVGDTPYLLHVGSTIARKRIDILLRVFAALRAQRPRLCLVRVGGGLSPEQARLADQLGVGKAVHAAPFLNTGQLAALYAEAALVLQTSCYEGFGLPVAEAQACGAILVASRIPVLQEVGGDAAFYCDLENISSWSRQALELLALREHNLNHWNTLRERSRASAQRYRWDQVAKALDLRYQYLTGILS
jgi:glycosyltransferase involved in cell wall biosynthesis